MSLVNSASCVCGVCVGVLHTGVLETTTGNSRFQKQVLKEGAEAWSQRTCFELDPLRQRSRAAAGSSNPSPAEGPFSGPGTQPAPLSSLQFCAAHWNALSTKPDCGKDSPHLPSLLSLAMRCPALWSS